MPPLKCWQALGEAGPTVQHSRESQTDQKQQRRTAQDNRFEDSRASRVRRFHVKNCASNGAKRSNQNPPVGDAARSERQGFEEPLNDSPLFARAKAVTRLWGTTSVPLGEFLITKRIVH